MASKVEFTTIETHSLLLSAFFFSFNKYLLNIYNIRYLDYLYS